MSILRIRKVVQEDIPAVRELVRALALNEDSPAVVNATFTAQSSDFMRDAFADPARFRSYVAEKIDEDKATIIGTVIFYETYSSYSGRPRLYIEDLFVVGDERCTGVGEMLVRKVAEDGLAGGCVAIDLAVLARNPARGFYFRLGFRHRSDFQFFRLSEAEMALLAQPSPE